jgi:hypothetical protein
LKKKGNERNKVIILTREGWYSLSEEGARFMELSG